MAIKIDKTVGRVLRALRRRIRTIDFVALACAYAGFALLFFLVAATADRWLILDRKVRIGILGTFGLVSLGFVPLLLVVLFRRMNSVYLARLVEKANPALGDSLLTCVQMARGEATFGEGFTKTVGDRVSADVSAGRVSIARAMPKRLVKVGGYFLLTIAVLFSCTAIAAGHPFFVCLRRVLFPRSNILPPTLTQIAEVQPGDTTTVPAKPVEISAVVTGVPTSSVLLYYAYDEKTWFFTNMCRAKSEERGAKNAAEPRPSGSGQPGQAGRLEDAHGGETAADSWHAQLPLIEKDATYFVAAGDTRSDQYRVAVVPPPTVQVLRARLKPPVYSGLPARETNGGNVDALLSTEVTIIARANRPLRKCAFVRGNNAPQPVKLAQNVECAMTFAVEKTEPYWFVCQDEFGFTDENPIKYDVVARKDLAPGVHIASPGSMEVPSNQPFNLMVTASDDCGLRDLSLFFRIKDRTGGKWRLPIRSDTNDKSPPVPRQPLRNAVVERTMLPAELGLKAGDSMLYFVEARDTCEPDANMGVSELCILKITPATPESQAAQQPTAEDGTDGNSALSQQAAQTLASLKSLKELLDALRATSPGLFSSPASSGDMSPLTPWELERLERLEEELAKAEEGENEEDGEYEDDYDDLLDDAEDCECDGT